MALTRKMLKAMGVEDDKIDQIIEAHTETVDGLKAERDSYKESAEKLPAVQKELEDLKKDVSDNDWKGKYDKEHNSFEEYKKNVEEKQTLNSIKEAYKNLLVKCKVGEKQLDAVMRVTDFSQMKLNAEGVLENADKLEESINSTWGGFITNKEVRGAGAETPPSGGGSDKGGNSGRAAQIAAKYHENLYGKVKEA